VEPVVEGKLNIGLMGYGNRVLWPDGTSAETSIMNDLDFALIEMGNRCEADNSYDLFTPGFGKVSKVRRTLESVPATFSGGQVSIILSDHDIRSGFLLERSSLFLTPAGTFETRKIKTEWKIGTRVVDYKNFQLTVYRARFIRRLGCP
jgi:hypothetical protein